MLNAPSSALYWLYIDEIEFGQNGLYPNAVTWAVLFDPSPSWGLGDQPDNVLQPQGEIQLFDDNVANPENWFLIPLVRR